MIYIHWRKTILKVMPQSMAKKFKSIFRPSFCLNINYNAIDSNQKRILICYLNILNEDFSTSSHSNIQHVNQMIHYFVQKDYCVDICDCNDLSSIEMLKRNKYDVILGFGKVYKQMICEHDECKKILFVTENDPEVVKSKYNERLEYFRKRHGNLYIHAEVRNGYYDQEQFVRSDAIVAMNSHYNTTSMQKYSEYLWNINSSGIINESFTFKRDEIIDIIDDSRCRFLWFGSRGIIHKGLDILLDLFRLHPEWTLDVYGLRKEESSLFNKLRPNNVNDCGKIDVNSEDFIQEVIMRHNVLLFPSCSEGMSTAVCTCLANGIIPVVTKECGYEPHESIIEVKSFRLEDMEEVVLSITKMSKEEIFQRRLSAFRYGREHFSLQHFDKQFRSIIYNILIVK